MARHDPLLFPNPVLIVSDRYPPDSHGGAELSLKMTVDRIVAAGVPVIVAALSDQVAKPTRGVHDGVTVYRVPYSQTSPPQVLWAARRVQRVPSRVLRSVLHHALASARYVAASASRGRRSRLSLLYSNFVVNHRLRLGRHFPINDRDSVDMEQAVSVLRELFEKVQPSLIHADNYRSILLAAAARPPGLPLIALVRDNRFFCGHRDQSMHIGGKLCRTCKYGCVEEVPSSHRKRLTDLMHESVVMRREALRRTDRVVVTSRFLAEQIGRMPGMPPVCIVSNPSDDEQIVALSQRGISAAQPPEILCVGMVNVNKGQLLLARKLQFFAEQLGDFRLVFAGRGLLLKKILALSERAGMRHRVDTPGYLKRPELYQAYARASVVASPTIWPEPFGRVPLEAGLSRRPIVAFAVGGLAETILHEETGLLLEPGDEEGFAEAIVRLIKDPTLARRLGENAYQHVTERYSLDNTASGLIEQWKAVLRREREAPRSEDALATAPARSASGIVST